MSRASDRWHVFLHRVPARMNTVYLREQSARGYSQWFLVVPGALEQCCDCGLVHDVQSKICMDGNGRIEMWQRVRRHRAETKKARKRKQKCVTPKKSMRSRTV